MMISVFRAGQTARRAIFGLVVAVALGIIGSAPAAAQADRPSARILVGFPPGAGTDTLARIYAEALSELANIGAIVENRPGAGGQIAAQLMKSATPESNTLMMAIDHQVVMLPITMKAPGFDVRTDMVPVGRMVNIYVCLAVPGSSPIRNFEQYVEAVRKNPEAGNFGVPAPGSHPQFLGYLMGRKYDIKTNPIPYRGAAPAIADLLGSQVQGVIVPCDALVEHHKTGRVRVLAMAADARYKLLPDVPTFGELGMEMPGNSFLGVYAASSMKPEMLKRVIDATARMFQSPKVLEKIAAARMEPAHAGPDELRDITEKATAFWREQVRQSNFQLQ